MLRETIGGFVELLHGRGLAAAVALARDERPAGEPLADEVSEIARWEGADVVDLGVASTPAAKLAARRHRLGGAVIVTGSHLAPEQTGLKLAVGPGYRPVDVSHLPRPAARAGRQASGRLRKDAGAAEGHAAAVCDSVPDDVIRASGMSADSVGGAGPTAELLLERLGCRFGRRPDVTLCLDADADRLHLLDERGEALDAELTLPLVLLARDARRIVKSSDTTRAVEAVAARRGATVLTVPPGEIHLFDALASGGGDLAGEGNGGTIVPAVGPGRDGLAAAATILGLMARRGQALSAIAAELPRFGRRRSTVPCLDPASAQLVLDRLARDLGVDGCDRWSGLQVDAGGDAWGLIRLSATEPLVRLTAEAPTQASAEALHRQLRGALFEQGLAP